MTFRNECFYVFLVKKITSKFTTKSTLFLEVKNKVLISFKRAQDALKNAVWRNDGFGNDLVEESEIIALEASDGV